MVAGAAGKFKFNQCDPATDYELWSPKPPGPPGGCILVWRCNLTPSDDCASLIETESLGEAKRERGAYLHYQPVTS